MSIDGRSSRALAAVAAVWILTACSGGGIGVDVPPGADELAPCPVTTIDVDGMGSDRAPDCDLEGSSVQISESLSFAIPAVGEVEVHEGVDVEDYYIVNWGVPGVGNRVRKGQHGRQHLGEHSRRSRTATRAIDHLGHHPAECSGQRCCRSHGLSRSGASPNYLEKVQPRLRRDCGGCRVSSLIGLVRLRLSQFGLMIPGVAGSAIQRLSQATPDSAHRNRPGPGCFRG